MVLVLIKKGSRLVGLKTIMLILKVHLKNMEKKIFLLKYYGIVSRKIAFILNNYISIIMNLGLKQGRVIILTKKPVRVWEPKRHLKQ